MITALGSTEWSEIPALRRHIAFKIIEAQVGGGEHLGQHDDLAGVHRDGKRNLNRFHIFCLHTH